MEWCESCRFAAWNVKNPNDICPAHLQGGNEGAETPCSVMEELIATEKEIEAMSHTVCASDHLARIAKDAAETYKAENRLLRECIKEMFKAKNAQEREEVLRKAGISHDD